MSRSCTATNGWHPASGKTLTRHSWQDQSIDGLARPIVTPIATYRGISCEWRSLGESNPCFSLERAAS